MSGRAAKIGKAERPLREKVRSGEYSTGDPVKDFLISRYQGVDPEAERIWRDLIEKVSAHAGLLVLVIKKSRDQGNQRSIPAFHEKGNDYNLSVISGPGLLLDIGTGNAVIPSNEHVWWTEYGCHRAGQLCNTALELTILCDPWLYDEKREIGKDDLLVRGFSWEKKMREPSSDVCFRFGPEVDEWFSKRYDGWKEFHRLTGMLGCPKWLPGCEKNLTKERDRIRRELATLLVRKAATAEELRGMRQIFEKNAFWMGVGSSLREVQNAIDGRLKEAVELEIGGEPFIGELLRLFP